MKKTLPLLILACFISFSNQAQTKQVVGGVNLIETQTYTAEENAEILKLYEKLRVADVSDGMDMVGLPNIGLVDPAIHPDWVDRENLSHIGNGYVQHSPG